MATSTPATGPVATESADDKRRHRRVLQALTGLLLGMFVSMLASTVVSTSLPVIVHDLGGDQAAFTWVVTAEDVRAYKPARPHFDAGLERIGERRDRWVHVAQSLYHDHAPAKALGIPTVWINRRRGKDGRGATPTAEVTPDLEFADMATFADFATGKEWLRR